MKMPMTNAFSGSNKMPQPTVKKEHLISSCPFSQVTFMWPCEEGSYVIMI